MVVLQIGFEKVFFYYLKSEGSCPEAQTGTAAWVFGGLSASHTSGQCLSVQVLIESPDFLLLVPVAVLLPRFPSLLFCACFCLHLGAAARLVAHHHLHPLRQGPHVFLRGNQTAQWSDMQQEVNVNVFVLEELLSHLVKEVFIDRVFNLFDPRQFSDARGRAGV